VCQRKRAAAEQPGDLLGVDPVVLRLPAVDRLHVERVAEDELDPFLPAPVGDPVPGKHALRPDDQARPVGCQGPLQRLGLRPQVAVQDDVALFVEHAHVHLARVEIDAAVESSLFTVKPHHGPPAGV